MTWRGIRAYWTATGVIPRWQLFAVYAAIVTAGAIGFARTGDALDGNVESRREAVRLVCQQQNERHDDTINKLDEVIAGLPPGPRLRRAEQNKAGTVLLINALVPKQDCDRRARVLVP